MSDVISLTDLQSQIEKICQAQGRSAHDVRVLAVSKLQPIEKIEKLHREGQKYFGENYVQELLEKQNQLTAHQIHWHLIGHLQKNKVKQMVGRCDLIHSVDSLELAKEISKRSSAASVRQNILLQVNVAHETSKEGFNSENLLQELRNILELPSLEVLGLMTMPPFVENPEENRPYFRQLRQLRDQIQKEFTIENGFKELSMGTSQDYAVAIEEGATWIRLGSTLFGERPPKK